jgi:hypothetical protein
MDFLDRITAVLDGQLPDRVPFAPYDNLAPRGDFSRELGNRGMGLLVRRPTISEEMPNVSIETKLDGETILTIYHTPVGEVSTRSRKHIRRISDDDILLDIEGMIKGVEDYDPVIFMIEDTQLCFDESVYHDTAADFGRDALVRDVAMNSPYGASRYLFGGSSGLSTWAFEQFDHPEHFERLIQALIRREERRLELALNSPARLFSFGDLDGTWGPEKVIQYDLPLYKKWIPRFQARGKKCSLHAHALNLGWFKEIIGEAGFDVIEAFTPPPVGQLSIVQAREAWGRKTILWINFPETIFWHGKEQTRQYAKELLISDAPGDALVIGFTEMGYWGGVLNKETEKIFKEGTLAIMEAIEQYGNVPIPSRS